MANSGLSFCRCFLPYPIARRRTKVFTAARSTFEAQAFWLVPATDLTTGVLRTADECLRVEATCGSLLLIVPHMGENALDDAVFAI